ncbi:MAG: sugar phosphate isomerase/epimerase [Firmicutes bacterium]|nr:sugar phosphate isomerase/epimerase [Bacillota bacterium]
MFKRAVITDEITQDFARAIDMAREFGLEGVELRSAWDRNPHELAPVQVRDVRRIAHDAGLEVACIAAPVFKCSLRNDSEYRAHIDILKRSVEVAHELGASLVRGFTFWAEGDFDPVVDLIVEKVRGAEPVLQDSGVTMVIEYDPATFASNTKKLAQVLEQATSEWIQALFDPGNNIYDPEGEPPYPDGYERIARWVKHVHVKDVKRNTPSGKPEAVVVGDGDVGFDRVFERLARDGYEGWASLETHYRKASAISDALLHRPMGSAFSEGGEEASRECLVAWNRMLTESGLIA